MPKVIASLLAGALVGCGAFVTPEPRFPQLNERPITGLGRHELPQWSPDGKYVAFIDSDQRAIIVYALESQQSHSIATETQITFFTWNPQGQLTYPQYRPDLSGAPFPRVFDLYQVNLDGTNDHVVFSYLYGPRTYTWLANGSQLIALTGEPNARNGRADIYLVDTISGDTTLLVSREELGLEEINSMALSSDETKLAIVGLGNRSGKREDVALVFEIGSHAIIHEIIPKQVLPDTFLRGNTLGWSNNGNWIIANGHAEVGECFRNSLLFLSTNDRQGSFCIQTVGDPIIAPDLSPDATHLAFITPHGFGTDFVILADFVPEYRSRLEQ